MPIKSDKLVQSSFCEIHFFQSLIYWDNKNDAFDKHCTKFFEKCCEIFEQMLNNSLTKCCLTF